MDLNPSNYFKKLSAEDWEIIFEFEEENYRRGNFKRIFPPQDPKKIDYYA